jgi:hypothetical protein
MGATERFDSEAPQQNGKVEPRRVGSVAGASVTADRNATARRVNDLQGRVERQRGECEDVRARLEAARERRETLEDHHKGWPLAVVAVLGLVTIALEYVPASMYTQIFLSAGDWLRNVLTWTFTVVGALLAVVLGELLRRSRRPEAPHVRDTVFTAIVGAMTLTYLYVGFKLRLAYTSASGDTAVNVSGAEEAFALTSIAMIGILLTVVSAYYRESAESFAMWLRVSGLERDLARAERHRDANQANLERATSPARRAETASAPSGAPYPRDEA